MTISEPRRVVITGMGVISPLGNSPGDLMRAIDARRSGIGPMRHVPAGALPIRHAAEAWDFTGAIENFGPLAKPQQRAIRKGQKLMCREIEMGVAAAQLAWADARLEEAETDRARTGVTYGCDYIMTAPEEFTAGISKCLDGEGRFDFGRWAELGLPQVNPLWLLKYLPNMPASHIAIYNDLRGPNNSLTLREASSCVAIAEAHSTIARGHADALIVGATGSRVMTFRGMHASMQETLATDRDDPGEMARPFAADRDGAVLGEGAAALICESLESALRRDAPIIAEVVGAGSSSVGEGHQNHQQRAICNALRGALRGVRADREVGHVHAHGLGTVEADRQEAAALGEIFGTPDASPPVVAAKSYFGNLGAGSGMIEVISSILCLQRGTLFPPRNATPPAADCPIRLADAETPAGAGFVSINVTPQGQAAAVRIAKFAG
jgi:3-oxoacyl-[acyl-carrier-protein] synthase II